MITDEEIRALKPGSMVRSGVPGLAITLGVHHKSPLWQYRFKRNGKQTNLSIGAYPDVSIDEAVSRFYRIRELINNGVPLSDARNSIVPAQIVTDEQIRALTPGKSMPSGVLGLTIKFTKTSKQPAWQYIKLYNGKQTYLSIGTYPELSIDEAIKRFHRMTELIDGGDDSIRSSRRCLRRYNR